MNALLSPAFFLASLLVIVTPGPDLALVTRTVAAHGRRAAVFAAIGMIAGGAAHVLLGLAGIGVLLAESPQWRLGIQLGGAVILVGYGVVGLIGSTKRSLVNSPSADSVGGSGEPSRAARRTVWAHASLGFCTNFTNIKVGLFLWAFLAPLVPPGTSLAAGTVVLAAAHLSLAFCWLMIWTVLSSMIINDRPVGFAERIDVVASAVIVVLGLLLAARTLEQA